MFACVALVMALLVAAPAHAQMAASRCADCHLAAVNPPAPDHLAAWERSPHARHLVGCEKCHGGDPTTFVSFRAHQGVLNSRNPASPVHPRNLTATCGGCHPGPFVGFQKSRHYALIQDMAGSPPSCVTCHDRVGADLLSPKALERQCNQCHGEGKVAPRGNRAAAGRQLLEQVQQVRTSLAAIRHVVDRMPKDARRTQFEEDWSQAEVPLVQGIHDAHAFVFDSALERIAVARDRTEALLRAVTVK